MADRLKYTLHGFWGERSVTADDVTERVRKSFEVLAEVGPPLDAPWTIEYTHAIDVSDFAALRAHVINSQARDDRGEPWLVEEFQPQFELGNYDVPVSVENDLGALSVASGAARGVGSSLVGKMVLTFEGETFATQARASARELLRGFARAWQPEYLAFTDSSLLTKRRQSRLEPGYPSWGYVAWVSDHVSSELDEVDGVTVERFGDGSLISTNTWDAQQAAEVWVSLVKSGRLRVAPPVQETLPAVP